MIPNLDDLKKAHRTLIVEYVNIVEEISELPFFVDIPSSPLLEEVFSTKSEKVKKGPKALPSKKSSRPWILKPLVNIFVRSHIRGKLNQLRTSYILLELTMKTKRVPDEYRKWLAKSAEECARFADILPLWQYSRWLIGVLLPLGIGLLLINVRDYPTAFLRIAIILIAFTVCSYISIFLAFSYKRNRFLYGSIRPIEHFWYSVPEEFDANVYQIEDKLFQLLRKKKNREFPVDIFYTIFLFLYFRLLSLCVKEHIIMRLFGFIFLLLLSFYLFEISKRRKLR